MAARSFAHAEDAAGEFFMPGSLRPRADLHYRATGNFSVDVRLERTRQLGERDRARDDAFEMARRAVARDAAPHREPFFAPGRGRIDAEQVHAAQDERQYRRRKRRAAREPDARDVAPEIHLPDEPGEHVAADIVDDAGIT